MNVGKPLRVYRVEPLRSPVPERQQQPGAPAPKPAKAPAAPAR